MDVPRFVTVEAVEEKPIRARNTGNRWQGGYLQLLAQTLDLLRLRVAVKSPSLRRNAKNVLGQINVLEKVPDTFSAPGQLQSRYLSKSRDAGPVNFIGWFGIRNSVKSDLYVLALGRGIRDRQAVFAQPLQVQRDRFGD